MQPASDTTEYCTDGNPPPSSRRSSSSDGSSGAGSVKPPDGGWGWVVVLGSFVAHLIADGCSFSFGVLYAELLDYFGESKGKTALVGSLFVSVPLITGPVASALTNRYGCQTTVAAGGLIAGVGFVVSAFADSIEVLCVTIGIVSGLGLSMVYVPAVVVVAQYFEKRRAFATGIAVAGSGIGTFVFAPLTQLLIDLYTWRGAVLIIGGLMFNVIVCGLLFRPLGGARRRPPPGDVSSSESSSESVRPSTPEPYQRAFTDVEPPLEERDDQHDLTHSLLTFPTYLRGDLDAVATDLPKGVDDRELCDFLKEHHRLEESRTNAGNAQTDGVVHANGNARRGTVSHSRPSVRKHSSKRTSCKPGTSGQHSLPMDRKDVFYRGSLLTSGRPIGSGGGRWVSCPDIVLHMRAETRNVGQTDSSPRRRGVLNASRVSREAKHIMSEMLDASILRSRVFLLFCASNMLLYSAYDVPYVYTPDKALHMGISSQRSSFLVSVIGITSTAGQVVIGYLGDHPSINTLLLYNALTSVAGVATMVVPLLTCYVALAVYCSVFGFFISANYALTTIILVNLLGMDKLTNAYGIVMLAEGVANVVGPPLAGWLSDVTGDYDMTFLLAGAVILLSGLMLFLVPYVRKWDRVSGLQDVSFRLVPSAPRADEKDDPATSDPTKRRLVPVADDHGEFV